MCTGPAVDRGWPVIGGDQLSTPASPGGDQFGILAGDDGADCQANLLSIRLLPFAQGNTEGGEAVEVSTHGIDQWHAPAPCKTPTSQPSHPLKIGWEVETRSITASSQPSQPSQPITGIVPACTRGYAGVRRWAPVRVCTRRRLGRLGRLGTPLRCKASRFPASLERLGRLGIKTGVKWLGEIMDFPVLRTFGKNCATHVILEHSWA